MSQGIKKEDTVELTDQDRKLIAEAAQAFREDHRYLESILWAAQARKPGPTKK